MKEALKTWKILDILKVTEELFDKNGILSPRLNAELLLCGTLNTKRINLYLDFEKPLSESEVSDYRNKVKRRLASEPLQYILGEAEFYGLKFKVNQDVLIPRQETELLVDKTLEKIISDRLENPKILEIGTGSGCISIAIAGKIVCGIISIDVSEKALKIAKENSAVNNKDSRITFKQCDFLNSFENFNEYDIVISNPPYIALKDMPDLQPEVKNFEPVNALTDNDDGLVFYRKILSCAKNTSKPLKLLIEIGDGKVEAVENLVKQYGISSYKFHKDLLDIYRVAEIEL